MIEVQEAWPSHIRGPQDVKITIMLEHLVSLKFKYADDTPDLKQLTQVLHSLISVPKLQHVQLVLAQHLDDVPETLLKSVLLPLSCTCIGVELQKKDLSETTLSFFKAGIRCQNTSVSFAERHFLLRAERKRADRVYAKARPNDMYKGAIELLLAAIREAESYLETSENYVDSEFYERNRAAVWFLRETVTYPEPRQ